MKLWDLRDFIIQANVLIDNHKLKPHEDIYRGVYAWKNIWVVDTLAHMLVLNTQHWFEDTSFTVERPAFINHIDLKMVQENLMVIDNEYMSEEIVCYRYNKNIFITNEDKTCVFLCIPYTEVSEDDVCIERLIKEGVLAWQNLDSYEVCRINLTNIRNILQDEHNLVLIHVDKMNFKVKYVDKELSVEGKVFLPDQLSMNIALKSYILTKVFSNTELLCIDYIRYEDRLAIYDFHQKRIVLYSYNWYFDKDGLLQKYYS